MDESSKAPAESLNLAAPEARMALAAALAPLAVAIAARIREWIADHPHIFNLETLKRFQEVQEWAEHLPQGLADSLGDGGVVLHPELSLPDLFRVTQAYREGGSSAAQAEMLRLQGKLFTETHARARVEARWRASARWPVLKDILAAHDAELYGTSVPVAIAQAEGIVAEGMKHNGRMKIEDFERHLDELFDDELEKPLMKLFRKKLLAPFYHGDEAPEFSRHAILHGGDWTYGTLDNSIRALAWVDCLLCVFQAAANGGNDQ
jgi:hypothetical protein